MKKNNIYLDRYAWPTPIFPAYEPESALDLIVVIPAYNETTILPALQSLNSCTHKENCLILIIINEPASCNPDIAKTNQQCANTLRNCALDIPFLVKHMVLPEKKAGVGLARKIGMDEAVRIFSKQNKNGIIACYDADCQCDPNYLHAIKNYYNNPANNLGLIHYEHMLTGAHNEAIVNYELYLRYYINALRWAGFEYAFQTLGSCITVTSYAYQKQGGMNTRKAGEDFYFIHKMASLGGLGEINDTCVRPSDRISDRVPFGTGHAVQKYLNSNEDDYPVYNPMIFRELKPLLENSTYLFGIDDLTYSGLNNKVVTFFHHYGLLKELTKISEHSKNPQHFSERFRLWFDGFKVLKFVHYLRDEYYPNIDLTDGLGWLNHEYCKIPNFDGSKEAKLILLRTFDRQAGFQAR